MECGWWRQEAKGGKGRGARGPVRPTSDAARGATTAQRIIPRQRRWPAHLRNTHEAIGSRTRRKEKKKTPTFLFSALRFFSNTANKHISPLTLQTELSEESTDRPEGLVRQGRPPGQGFREGQRPPDGVHDAVEAAQSPRVPDLAVHHIADGVPLDAPCGVVDRH